MSEVWNPEAAGPVDDLVNRIHLRIEALRRARTASSAVVEVELRDGADADRRPLDHRRARLGVPHALALTATTTTTRSGSSRSPPCTESPCGLAEEREPFGFSLPTRLGGRLARAALSRGTEVEDARPAGALVALPLPPRRGRRAFSQPRCSRSTRVLPSSSVNVTSISVRGRSCSRLGFHASTKRLGGSKAVTSRPLELLALRRALVDPAAGAVEDDRLRRRARLADLDRMRRRAATTRGSDR